MELKTEEHKNWINQRIKQGQIDKYLADGKNFIDEDKINSLIEKAKSPDKDTVLRILEKSLNIKTLSLKDVACLLNVTDPDLWELMQQTALTVKKKVYDNRIVTFAPLYLGNACVNNCLYCAFRKDNHANQRKILSLSEIEKEVRVLCGKIGHKRLVVVYGEHPSTGIDYMVNSVKTIYGIREKTVKGVGQIRRVNVNAAPLSIEELKRLHEVGIGTYQVFQETYHPQTYRNVHPENTLKGNYNWRLYVMHRAMEAGIDDVGLGVLFGLYDWKFEVMGLITHNLELEAKFGVGAHTISFPRIEPADNTPLTANLKYKVSDEDFKKIITVLRLAVPHTGLIITARENAEIRKQAIALGITQTDASTKIAIGSYSDKTEQQQGQRQQFILGDTRSLEELINEYIQMGYITSFCTAGYRCGRTGECIMDMLRSGKEGKFCKLNAVLTFREWVDDFASEKTKAKAEEIIAKEIQEIKQTLPQVFEQFMEYYNRVKNGERDLYF
ncbi:MAG: [FeFe] hydrogenase H-cluster radical SAM maturase HydG [Candidatus Omnitrophica bacterium]|nr:[FeFe] hydrogenase H-cluster radical SAM maturase HydG [Candidatus Omnitrophota bacterium]